MGENIKILKLSGKNTCAWHQDKEEKNFKTKEILPQNICPWLYHAVYPYFLGLFYGAKFSWNTKGDCNVCCPASRGVDVLVRKRKNRGSFDRRIKSDTAFVIFAQVVKVRGKCRYGHKKGERFIFPTCMKEYYLCPAGFNNILPFMKLKPPKCIDTKKLRCPDWANTVLYNIDKGNL